MLLYKHIAWLLVTGFSAVHCRNINLEMNPPSLDDANNNQVQVFEKKRCGVKDIIKSPNTVSRARRYIIDRGWNKRNITYSVVNGSKTLPRDRVEALMARALAVWAPYGGLQFSRLDSGVPDIQISFVRGDHGDGFPFEGASESGEVVVAHAFNQGNIHFNDDLIWSDNVESLEQDPNITDLFFTAVHEIGHVLGLSHSDVKASVMYGFYKEGVKNLFEDDILGMQELYMKEQPSGRAEATNLDTPVVPRVMNAEHSIKLEEIEEEKEQEEEENYYPDLCMTNYDTLQVIQGKIYVFEEEWLWVLADYEVEEGYPRRFHDVFRGLPPTVNVIKTIYEKANGNVVIFAGRKFWEFDPTFRLIRVGDLSEYSIPSQVPELTTVFISNHDDKTYLIEEERFWRYDERTNKMDKGYPKDMSVWRKVPYPVDAAIIWDEQTFFFKGPRFWGFDNTMKEAYQDYPAPVAQVWFNCAVTEEMDNYITNDGP